MRIGNVPPTGPAQGSQQPSDVPPQAQAAATDMANQATKLSNLYAQYAAATDPQQKNAIMAKINMTMQAIGNDLNTLHGMSSQLPPAAQAQIDELASLSRGLAEHPEQVTAGQLAVYDLNIGKLCDQLGC